MVENLHLFGREIGIYMICSLAGLLAAGFFAYRLAKRNGETDETDFVIVLLFGLLGAFVGMHLLYGVTNWRLFPVFFEQLDRLRAEGKLLAGLTEIFGGSVFYGGLLGGLAAGGLACRIKGLNSTPYLDITAVIVPFFHVFGRLGCFLSGCCYGLPSAVGFVYTCSPAPEANGISRFPIQLVEAFCNLLIFLLLYFLYRKGKEKGRLLLFYFLLYGTVRFTLEFFRGDVYRGFFLGLSTSQWISLALVLFALVRLLFLHRKKNPAGTKS